MKEITKEREMDSERALYFPVFNHVVFDSLCHSDSLLTLWIWKFWMFVCMTRLGTDNRCCTSCMCVMGNCGGGVMVWSMFRSASDNVFIVELPSFCYLMRIPELHAGVVYVCTAASAKRWIKMAQPMHGFVFVSVFVIKSFTA